METTSAVKLAFELPKLMYAYTALEPHIDKQTMQIHYEKHHGGYVDKLNNALTEKNIHDVSLEEIIKNVTKYGDVVRNNAGGHYNHSMFWKILTPGGATQPTGKLGDAIKTTYGTFDKFKEEFEKVAAGVFGSGWAWLVLQNGQLKIGSTPNQDNPLMDIAKFKGKPIMGLDVWEHAYYLKYQNRRPDYIKAFWNILNWDVVGQRYEKML